ncbi:hypothetical protein [Cesiribacter andamanensis]|uniref:Uncharacterized protein n=1 Tax=Cesiribacter andamanensis AMV16 TaxID=1279009 RepID=M7N5F8_9BACT|nr:hypothetical protein [Cesiribacter andamanensis]EMR02527.1 hypothetical protein ADICEAN_02334 [Cesiribacter andamanensis AMV16]
MDAQTPNLLEFLDEGIALRRYLSNPDSHCFDKIRSFTKKWYHEFSKFDDLQSTEMAKALDKAFSEVVSLELDLLDAQPSYLQLYSILPPMISTPLEENPQTFADIFTTEAWPKYINALAMVAPPVIDAGNNFIGSPRKHKGVICSWIKYLQSKGIIRQSVNRSQLAGILNREIKGLNLGTDGKTFDNISEEYLTNYESRLIAYVK